MMMMNVSSNRRYLRLPPRVPGGEDDEKPQAVRE
jgi:hypothetical protein